MVFMIISKVSIIWIEILFYLGSHLHCSETASYIKNIYIYIKKILPVFIVYHFIILAKYIICISVYCPCVGASLSLVTRMRPDI